MASGGFGVIGFLHPGTTAVAGDLAVEDGQARLKLGQLPPDMLAMPPEEVFPFRLARDALRPQRGIPD
ncbi:hypothetical protein RQ832_28995, partial [Roseomonas sp. DSM 102946]|nr:hypothetical protein [Roseomonas sp. DSM 102946]